METKIYIWIFLTIGGIFGGFVGTFFDHGNALGAWTLIFSTIGSFLGIWVGYRLGNG